MKSKNIIIGLTILGVLAVITYVFLTNLPQEIIDNYGIILAIIPLAALFLIFIIFLVLTGIISGLKFSFKKIKSSFAKKEEVEEKRLNERELKQKRELLNEELKEAEKQFLKNKISKEIFDSLSKEKHAQLIGLETLIDGQKKLTLDKSEIKKINEVSIDKKKILKGLFEQKLLKAHELNLAEQSYLKRKIDESTFTRINSNIKKEIISIDSQIELINKTEAINKIKNQLKEGAKEIAKQKKNTKVRNLEEIIQDDVIDQLNIQR